MNMSSHTGVPAPSSDKGRRRPTSHPLRCAGLHSREGARVDIFGFTFGSRTCWRLLYLNKHFLFAKENGLKAET